MHTRYSDQFAFTDFTLPQKIRVFFVAWHKFRQVQNYTYLLNEIIGIAQLVFFSELCSVNTPSNSSGFKRIQQIFQAGS